jgi:hypothetical protein
MANQRRVVEVKLKAIKDTILIHNLEQGGRALASGIVLINDDGKEHGVRSRWAQVYATGPDEASIKAGQWVLLEHGRWSRGLEVEKDLVVHRADNESILLVSDEETSNEYIGTSTEHGFTKVRY